MLLKGKGDGTLVEGATIPALSGPMVALGTNGDGALDVMEANDLSMTRFMNFGPAAVTPSSLLWQAVALRNSGAPKMLTLTNLGERILVLYLLMTGSDPEDFAVKENSCGGQFHPGAKCSITVAFRPQATGSRNAMLQVTDNFGQVTEVPLTGVGTL